MRIEALQLWVTRMLAKAGVAHAAASLVAEALVAADAEGIGSHGVMLLPMYVERLLAGSVSTATEAALAHDGGAAVTLDARHMLGQLSSKQAVNLVIERARRHGIAAVAVRNGFHFGAAGYWAQKIADAGLVGVAACNTRPLMPAPGGAERVVGNNPLAIALPGDMRIDMATSATAMGRIRLAEAAGEPIPEGWAADAEGRPTRDAAQAIKGMLLPAAGPKGFGLAVAIDLLCGGLSAGAAGDEVAPLYGDPAVPYRSSHLFIALDPARFGIADFRERTEGFAERIRRSRRAPGTERIYAPGDLGRARRAAGAGDIALPPETLQKLEQCAARVGVERSLQ